MIRKRISDIQEISGILIQILGGASLRINLGDEPVIVIADALSPTEIMEMDKDKLLGMVMHHGSAVSHASIMAKTMEIPTIVDIPANDEWDGQIAIRWMDIQVLCIWIRMGKPRKNTKVLQWC